MVRFIDNVLLKAIVKLPSQTWELTLLSHGNNNNKKKKNKKKNPHPNSTIRSKATGLKFCMGSWMTKRISLDF